MRESWLVLLCVILLAGVGCRDLGRAPPAGPGVGRRDSSITIRSYPCPRRTGPVTIDGNLDEWKSLPFVCDKPTQLQFDIDSHLGPKDALFRFAVEYDEKYLYVAVEVRDDYASYDPNLNPGEQDGIEVRVDARDDPKRSEGRGDYEFDDVFLAAMSPAASAEESMVFYRQDELPEGAQAVCVKTASGHNIEVAVPVEWLNKKQGKKWGAFRLNIAVDDLDATGGVVQLWWQPDWRTEPNIPGSGTFVRK